MPQAQSSTRAPGGSGSIQGANAATLPSGVSSGSGVSHS